MPDQQQEALMLERLAVIDDPIFFTSPGELLAQAAEEERRRAAGPKIRMVKAPRPAPEPQVELESKPAITGEATATPKPAAPLAGGARLPGPGQTVDLDKDWWPRPAPTDVQTVPPEPATEPEAAPAATQDQPASADPVDVAGYIVRAHLAGKDDGGGAYDRMAEALEALGDRLTPPPEPLANQWETPLGRIAWWGIYNGGAAAAAHWGPAIAGYPTWSLPRLVHDLIASTTVPSFHWSTSLIVSGIIAALVRWQWDKRTRKLPFGLDWAARIPLASVIAGSFTATWAVIVHLVTGASA
jgi:hypothetical protein